MPIASALDRIAPWASQQLLSAMGNPPLRIVLWDGRGVGPPESQVVGSVHFHDRGVLALILADAEFQFGELFSAGRITVEGDLVAVVERGLVGRLDEKGLLTRLLPHRLLAGAIRTDLGRARANAQHHYDVGNDFYALWLDERMLYTCAYFPEPDASQCRAVSS